MLKKNKAKFAILCAIILVCVAISIFYLSKGIKDNSEGVDMTKELFFDISKESIYKLDINKQYTSESDILTSSKDLLKKADDINFDLNKYYFVNINGNLEEEYIKTYVMLYTYKNNTLTEQFKLGVNSIYNVIYLTKEYDYIRFELVYSGKGSFSINDIDISEILNFKELDISNVQIEREYIEDFDMAEAMFNSTFKPSDKEKIINYIKDDIYIYYLSNEYTEVKIENFEQDQNLITDKRETLLRINGFANILGYLKLYKETGEEEIIYKYYALIEKWIDEYIYCSQEDELVYNDMATAYRVYNWTRFYEVAEKHLSIEQKTKLLTSLIYQANLLEELQYNGKGTNHGLYQDISSLFYLQVIKGEYNSIDKLKNTVNNIEKYFENCISEEGVHLEHSPEYHIYMLESIEDLINIFSRINIDTTNLQSKLEKMEDFLLYITKPDGKLPEISDTDVRKVDFSIYIEDEKLNNKVNFSTDIVYKDEGYAIFRDSWNSGEKGTYVLFYNAYNSYYHKHSDENGLWIYRDGDIIREAGKNGYTYTDPFTKYAYSSWGHNTLIVNGKGLVEEKNIPNDYNYKGTYIKDYNIENKENVWVTGVNERYENVIHERKVNYNKTEDIIYVSDNITSTEENEYALLWHLALDITVNEKANSIDLYRDNKIIMTIEFETDDKYSIQIVKGQIEPKILGWYSNGSDNPEETTTIKIDFEKAKNVNMSTKFIFKN